MAQLTNNQLGRLQLTLAEILNFRCVVNHRYDKGNEMTGAELELKLAEVAETITALWRDQSELDKIADMLKTLYNLGQPVQLVTNSTLLDAAQVISLDPKISAWLEKHDPKALEQIRAAIKEACKVQGLWTAVEDVYHNKQR